MEVLPEEPAVVLPDEYLPLDDLLRRLMEQAGHHYASIPTRHADAAWVGYRLAELLPLDALQKQQFLEMDDPLRRLARLTTLLEGLALA